MYQKHTTYIMAFGNNTIDFNSLGIKQPSKTIFQSQSVMRVVDDNVDWETGAILDDDNVAFTYGEGATPAGATLIQEREQIRMEEIRYEDATVDEIATAQEQGSIFHQLDTTTQEHQDLFDGMGRFTGSGDEPMRYGEGVGGVGTQTFVGRVSSVFQRAWCLVGDCSEVNTNTQRVLDDMSYTYNEEDEPNEYSNTGIGCYNEDEEYICDDDGNLITESTSGSSNSGGGSGGLGTNNMSRGDEEALQRKEDETHVKGGSNENLKQKVIDMSNEQKGIAVIGIGALGFGLYKLEKDKGVFTKAYNDFLKMAKGIMNKS